MKHLPSIVQYLKARGIEPYRVRGSQYTYFSPLRDERTPSFHVDDSRDLWFDFGRGDGGDLIKLVQLWEHLEFREVMAAINGAYSLSPSIRQLRPQPRPQPREDVKVEVTNALSSPLRDYLRIKRCIPSEVFEKRVVEVRQYRAGRMYESIGFATDSGGYAVRSPFFKGCIGHQDISTRCQQGASVCYVVEGFMDYLSLVAACNFVVEAIVLNSCSNVKKAIAKIKQLAPVKVSIITDTDQAGDEACHTLLSSLSNAVDDRQFLREAGKNDLNDWWRYKLYQKK